MRGSKYAKSGQKLFNMGKIVAEISKQQLPEIPVKRELTFSLQKEQEVQQSRGSPRTQFSVQKRDSSLNETGEVVKRGAFTVFDLSKSAKKVNVKSTLVKPDTALINTLLSEEQDERYRYLLRNSTVHFVEQDTGTLFVELKQIPNITVVYRRPFERIKNAENIQLDDH